MIRPDIDHQRRLNTQTGLIPVCIACSIPLFSTGLRDALHSTSDIHVVAEAANCDETLTSVKNRRPAVLLLDAAIRGGGVAALLRRMNQQGLSAAIIIICASDTAEFEKIDYQGSISIMTLTDGESEFIRAVRTAAAGKVHRSDSAKHHLRHLPSGDGVSNEDLAEKLTPTEIQILGYLKLGNTSRQIAEALFISYRTVQKHRANIAHKLGLSGSNALLAYALLNTKQGR